MSNSCIYRTRYKNCKCNNQCDNINSKFCQKHIKYKNIGLFDIINKACGNYSDLLNNQKIYNIFYYIYYNYKDIEIDDLKKKLFIKIIAYLFSLNDILKFSNWLLLTPSNESCSFRRSF